jgi:hypothetical protein
MYLHEIRGGGVVIEGKLNLVFIFNKFNTVT